MDVLTISGGSEIVCRSVSISDNGIVEYDETFNIELSNSDESVFLSLATAEIVIRNDDSELLFVM